MKTVIFFIVSLLGVQACFALDAQEAELTPEQQEFLEWVQNDTFDGDKGPVRFSTANCTMVVPEGFVYLDKEQSKHLLVDYWDNPEERMGGVLGTLVKADAKIFFNVETAYVISYENDGYVSDEDAASIDYDDLLKSIQEAYKEENKNNPTGKKWEMLGWGWQPNYDNQKKVLAWSQLLRVDGEEVINYDVRILGRNGFVVIKAVAGPEAKEQLLADNAAIVGSVVYDDGYRYSDFNPETDHVAEWTIGGLIAGKVLAKAGFWAVLGKFSKLIILAIIGFFATAWKKILRLLGFAKED